MNARVHHKYSTNNNTCAHMCVHYITLYTHIVHAATDLGLLLSGGKYPAWLRSARIALRLSSLDPSNKAVDIGRDARLDVLFGRPLS